MNEEELKQAMKELIFIPKEELIKALLNKQQEVLQLKEQLKQRDEVIDEAIKLSQNLKEQIKLTLDDYDKEHSYQNAYQQIDDVKYHYEDIKEVLDILQKYKGDNK